VKAGTSINSIGQYYAIGVMMQAQLSRPLNPSSPFLPLLSRLEAAREHFRDVMPKTIFPEFPK
jgi:hypothetical protein